MNMRWIFRKRIWDNRQAKGFAFSWGNREDSNGFPSRDCIVVVCLLSADKISIVNRNSIAVSAWNESLA